MKLKITTNYSFSKLSDNLDKIMNDSLKDYSKKVAVNSKKRIDRGLRKLNDVTVKIRKHRNQPPRPALKASGALYNSIKPVDDGMQILEYGILQHGQFGEKPKSFITGEGSVIPNKEVLPRPFITINIKDRQTVNNKFVSNLNKNLKK